MPVKKRYDETLRRKSDPGIAACQAHLERQLINAGALPWGGSKMVPITAVDLNLNPGAYACQSLLYELFAHIERKLKVVSEEEPLDKLLNKSLQRGGDSFFDNHCNALSKISELCLPAVLKSLISWFDRMEKDVTDKLNPGSDNRFRLAKYLLAVNYVFCLILLEVLPQLELHVKECSEYITRIMNIAFNKIAYRDPSTLAVNLTNALIVAETYAEVIGALSTTCFKQIHRTFSNYLCEYKKETSPNTSHNVIALLVAMKYVKIKTNEVHEFESGIAFLDDLATYFIELKDREVKHAVAGLLVEILLPVASQIKREINIPAMIGFVQKMYNPVNDLISKKQHKLAAYPLLTCLLCVSQKHFFLTNWVNFLNSCLSSLRNKDTRVSRIALESLYRLLWVYIIRNNCEGNTSTRTRLESICASLFPKGNRHIIPREAPLNIFVKIIHFIAQQKLDFAFKEIIYDLLGCTRSIRSLCPERMNIGIRAIMVIADGLQQKDEPPAMPKNMGPLASGTMARSKKKTYITQPLTADIAKNLGLEQYYTPCRKAFDNILRVLDAQVGKPLMLTAIQGRGKEPEADVKPKLDLFRTCVAAMPRLLPEPMTSTELIDILIRITIHIDEELRTMSSQTLQNIMAEFPDWRETIITSALNLLTIQLTDHYPMIFDMSLRTLLDLLQSWKLVASTEKRFDDLTENASENAQKPLNSVGASTASQPGSTPSSATHSTNPSASSTKSSTPPPLHNWAGVLHAVEGFALVTLCQVNKTESISKKLAISLLREVKAILETLRLERHDTPMLTVLDEATPYVIKKYIHHVPFSERLQWKVDFAGACDKICSIEPDAYLVNGDKGNEYMRWDPWACALSGYAESKFLLTRCPTAVAVAWPALCNRLNAVTAYVDPSNPQNESRASLLRSSKSKATSAICGEQLSQDGYLSLWPKYVVLCMALCPVPPSHHTIASRSFSPTSTAESEAFKLTTALLRSKIAQSPMSYQQLFQKALQMLKWENLTDIRDSVAFGVGSLNSFAIDAFLDEPSTKLAFKEAQDKKMESNVRRRKRKDLLRLQILRFLEVAIFRGYLDSSVVNESPVLHPTILDFIDFMRINLKTDQDRDITIVTSMRLHFAKLVASIIDSVPYESRENLIPDDRKKALFELFVTWCSKSIGGDRRLQDVEVGTFVEQQSIFALTRILCCGSIFEKEKSLGPDGELYSRLERLVCSTNMTMQIEAEKMLAWLVQLNDSTELVEWLVNQCYAQPPPVSSRCVKALVRAFSRRERPFEFISLFVLCQAALCDKQVADCALFVLEILRKQYLDNPSAVASPLLAATSPSAGNVPLRRNGNSLSMPVTGLQHPLPAEQLAVCRALAKAYPQQSIIIFSEVCARIEHACAEHQASLLAVLQPWIKNLELVDSLAGEDACEGPRGYGSGEATQLLLINLFYLTTTYLAHEKEICELWRMLALAFPANIPIIIHFLYTITNISPDRLLVHAKRVAVMIAGVAGTRVAALLLELLVAHDNNRLVLERAEIPPFFRWREDVDPNCLKGKDSFETSIRIQEAKKTEAKPERDEETAIEGVRELPMPPYGGHFCPISFLLPPVSQPIQCYTKSQVSLLLLCDVIRSSCDVDWTEATPRLLHAAVLYLDSLRPLLCVSARQTIINVCLLRAAPSQLSKIAQILLDNRIESEAATMITTIVNGTSVRDPRYMITRSLRGENWREETESPTFQKLTHDEYRNMLLHSNAVFSSQSELILAIVFCLSETIDMPLWANEDASPRCWRVPSASQLTCLVRHIASLLLPTMQLLPVVWTQIAMKMALSLPQRHLAGRCFQIVSALCQPPGAWIPSLISRLVEIAGDTNEDMQAYITNMFLCLHSSVQHLSPPPETVMSCSVNSSSISPTHARSTSYTPALLRQSGICSNLHERKDARLSLLVAEEEPWVGASLVRSKSAEQLKTDREEEEVAARSQMLAMAIVLLESNVDNEFLLALHLLNKILTTSDVQKAKCLDKFEKTLEKLDWKSSCGITGLVSRGIIIQGALEQTIEALLNLIELADHNVVGGKSALSLIVISVLPYMLVNFDQPTTLCLRIADALNEFCKIAASKCDDAADHPLTHLATMFSAYSKSSFSKDSFQWAKCVVQYTCDGLEPNTTCLVALLAEMLDRNPPSQHVYALHILYLLMLQRDNPPSAIAINGQVLRSVVRHLGGSNFREAARVFQAAVEQEQKREADKESASITSFSLDPAVVNAGVSDCVGPRLTLEPAMARRQTAQAHVRENLVGLLSASGLRVGIPNAPSVLFLHSEFGSATSSTERLCSSRDVDSTASLPADTSVTDSFPRVFKEFDFLEAEHDSVSETAESCFGWLSTMRPTSIADRERNSASAASDEADDENDDESEESSQHDNSLSNENEIGLDSHGIEEIHSPLNSITEDGTASDERTPCPSEVGEDDNKEVAETSVMLEDDENFDAPTYDTCSYTNEWNHPLTTPSVSGRSVSSVEAPVTRPSPLNVLCSHHAGHYSQIEFVWMQILSDVPADDVDGEKTAQAVFTATLLFRMCCWRARSLLQDAAQGSFAANEVTRALLSAQDVLSSVADCPFLFLTPNFLLQANCLQKLRFSLAEMREHIDTFNERREQAMRALISLKSAHKLSSLLKSQSSISSASSIITENESYKSLHRVFFQLMLMNDAICDMVRAIKESPASEDFSLSPAVQCLHRDLLQCAAELPSSSVCLPRESVADSLLLLLANKQFSKAIFAIRQLRASSPSLEYGCCEGVDVEVLLLIFCRSQTMKVWALAGGDYDILINQSSMLRAANADLSSAVRRPVDSLMSASTCSSAATTSPGIISLSRTPTMSSLTESFTKIQPSSRADTGAST